MFKLLIFIAIFQIVLPLIGPILSIVPFSWLWVINSIVSAISIIALAVIYTNQEEIIDKLDRQEEKLRKLLSTEKKVCKRCNYSYDFDYKSCPNCGYRED